LYVSTDIIRAIKSRTYEIGGACNTLGEMRNAHNNLNGKTEGRSHLEDLGIDGKIILEWILGK
jgi:hypothetical protein